ncbi:hypothetical protein [Escherichia coli]|uniref:hypothetical protein n=1 Tax=Escherichia coli TaxID=562 RepID=UPI0002A44DE0|nr:hypothetical protein [Escherichia coli]ELF95376.1 hypothetical protein A1S5_04642 [Escherichia coli KTE48]ELF96799.1 hypothetical protein A1S5_04030 [Escherichia coli KTE48]
MKKLIIASAIAMTMASGAAMAATATNNMSGEVQFIGSVTAETCDLVPSVGGATKNTIDLGTVTANETGNPVDFALVKADAAACTTMDAAMAAEVTWGGQFTPEGLSNTGGTAAGAIVLLDAMNAGTTPESINSAKQTVIFKEVKDKLDNGGLKFQAKLQGGAAPGTFLGTAYYAVAYK